MRLLLRTVIILTALLGPAISLAAESLPHSVLILDQSDSDSAWYDAFSSAFRSTLNAGSAARISVYAEHLDLSRFGGPRHDALLRTYLRDKFRERPIGVLVAQGSSALEFVMQSRGELWPGVPVVFAAVDEETATRLNLPPDVTGTIYQLTFRNAVRAAQVLVPHLKRIALVGDPLERQAVRRHFKEEVPVFAAEFELIDLTGLPMTEVRKRVAVLPDHTAIIYTAINVDGAGVAYIPHEALGAVAEVANRPIVIDAATSIGYGGTGGFIVSAAPVGEEVAQLALRILNGESASQIPVVRGSYTKPMFDWRQLQRWNISENRLPPGSEIRFRSLTMWGQYRWQMIAVFAALLIQTAMIAALLFEHRRRRVAELESRRRLMDIAHTDRAMTAGIMSASLAHELKQPLTAMLINTRAAEALLAANPPDLDEVKEILADIRRDDQRAGEIIGHLRGLLKKGELRLQNVDVNDVIQNVIHIVEPEAARRGVVLSVDRRRTALAVRADQVHLQQVMLNLAINGMDAMQDSMPGKRRLAFQAALIGESEVEVSVSDTGTGIPEEKLKGIFESFVTTKPEGTGLGLSIVRTIVETYGGKIWAENRVGGGAVFRFSLPLVKAHAA